MPAHSEDPSRPLSGHEATLRAQLDDALRPGLNALARIIVTDRRASALLSRNAEVLLINRSGQRAGLEQARLPAELNWPALCRQARRAGLARLEWRSDGMDFTGTLVHVPIGPAETFFLRLSESDQESLILRNNARAASLMRLAHDLRTPIQSLLAAAQALLASEDTPQPEERERMRRAAQLSLDHINAVLGALRGEGTARVQSPEEDFRIREELERILALVAPIARERKTELALTVEAPEGLTLHGPLALVRAALQNLIDNTVNHGGGRVDLRLSCRPLIPELDPEAGPSDAWLVELELADEGGGLSDSQKNRLFNALNGESYKTDEKQARQSAGIDVLGHALRLLGGELTLSDRGADGAPLAPGDTARVTGTIFRLRFSLPGRVAPAAAFAGAPAAGSVAGPLAGRTILLVEDSPSARDWIRHVLEGAGARVMPAGSGPEALSLLFRDGGGAAVDLVLTDVTLPRMSGIELAARMRRGDAASPRRWEGPIIGLTAHADDQIRAACRRAGMDQVLEKPLPPDALTRALAEAFGGNHGEATAPAAPMDDVIASDVMAALNAQMGPAATRGFMARALAEARMVFQELRDEGIVPDSGRRLHAATGACGLTGLKGLEVRLRAIEKAVEAGPEALAPLLAPMEAALRETEAMLENLPPGD